MKGLTWWWLLGLVSAQVPISWKVALWPQKESYAVGDTVILSLKASIPPPYHLYSSRPTAKPANLPTTLTLDAQTSGVRPIGPLQEIGKLITVYDEIFETEVFYYEGEVTFQQKFYLTQAPAQIVGYLRYQYCDEEQCYTEKLELDQKLTVLASNSSIKAKDQTPATSPPSKMDSATGPNLTSLDTSGSTPQPMASVQPILPTQATAATTPSRDGAISTNRNIWGLFLKAFLFGLAAVLTPCTFPMIPLTVSYFTKALEGRRGFPLLALCYSLSILLIFWLLGGIVTIFFGASAAYNISTNPWLNLIFFVILLAFGLSFLGLFEIRLPASWGTATSRYASTRSLGGVFFMALTLVLVSFSCVGPLLGTLLIDMVGGSYWAPFVGMTGFGLAFALPFGLLAGIPQLLQKLPRSGAWMETFKVTLGFLELVLALKFLSNADLVWHLGILDREVYLTAWIVLFLTLGLYLMGFIPLGGHKPEAIGVLRLLTGMSSLGLGIYLFTGLWGAPLKAFSGLLPPIHDEIGVRLVGGNAQETRQATCDLPPDRLYVNELRKHTPPEFCVFYDLEEAKAYAASVNKPLFIDFTGHTCVNCRQVENSVWQDPTIRRLLQEQYVMVSLFVDDATPLPELSYTPTGEKLRTLGDKWLALEKTLYRIQAQPFYVLTDTTLVPLVPPQGFTLDKEAYRAFLEAGLSAYQAKRMRS